MVNVSTPVDFHVSLPFRSRFSDIDNPLDNARNESTFSGNDVDRHVHVKLSDDGITIVISLGNGFVSTLPATEYITGSEDAKHDDHDSLNLHGDHGIS